MDNWRAGSCHGETAFGEFMSRHLKAIMCGVMAMPCVIALFIRDPGEPTKTVWIADSAELSSYENRTGFILDALETGENMVFEDILENAPAGELGRFDAFRIELSRGYDRNGELRRRVDELNSARDRIDILVAGGENRTPTGSEVASRTAP